MIAATKESTGRSNGLGKSISIVATAIATGLGSSYLTVITATPSRSEVRQMIEGGIAVVKDTAGLDRATMLEWKQQQAGYLSGLRADVQRLSEQQAGMNRMLEILVNERKKESKP